MPPRGLSPPAPERTRAPGRSLPSPARAVPGPEPPHPPPQTPTSGGAGGFTGGRAPPRAAGGRTEAMAAAQGPETGRDVRRRDAPQTEPGASRPLPGGARHTGRRSFRYRRDMRVTPGSVAGKAGAGHAGRRGACQRRDARGTPGGVARREVWPGERGTPGSAVPGSGGTRGARREVWRAGAGRARRSPAGLSAAGRDAAAEADAAGAEAGRHRGVRKHPQGPGGASGAGRGRPRGVCLRAA